MTQTAEVDVDHTNDQAPEMASPSFISVASLSSDETRRAEIFVSMVDMRARLLGNGCSIMQAFDRLACPMPGNAHMIRMKAAANDILKWSQKLDPEDRKVLQLMMSNHIKTSVQHLKQDKTAESKENS